MLELRSLKWEFFFRKLFGWREKEGKFQNNWFRVVFKRILKFVFAPVKGIS